MSATTLIFKTLLVSSDRGSWASLPSLPTMITVHKIVLQTAETTKMMWWKCSEREQE